MPICANRSMDLSTTITHSVSLSSESTYHRLVSHRVLPPRLTYTNPSQTSTTLHPRSASDKPTALVNQNSTNKKQGSLQRPSEHITPNQNPASIEPLPCLSLSLTPGTRSPLEKKRGETCMALWHMSISNSEASRPPAFSYLCSLLCTIQSTLNIFPLVEPTSSQY